MTNRLVIAAAVLAWSCGPIDGDLPTGRDGGRQPPQSSGDAGVIAFDAGATELLMRQSPSTSMPG